MAPGTGSLRLIRLALFALAAVGLASAAHLAGGESIAPVPVVLSVPAVMIVMNLLAASRRGYLSLLVSMSLTQVALHAAFMVAAISSTCHVVGSQAMVGMAMPAGSGAAVGTGATAGAGGAASTLMHCDPLMTHGAAGGLLPSGAMLAWHALATVVLAAVLAHGEAALWALAEALGFRIVPLQTMVQVPAVRRLAVAGSLAFRPRPDVRRRTVRRRGPPELACAAC